MAKRRYLSDHFNQDLKGFRILEVCYLREPPTYNSPRVEMLCRKTRRGAGPVIFFPEGLLHGGLSVGRAFRGWHLHKGYALVHLKTGRAFWLNGFQSTERYPSRPAGLWVTKRRLAAWRRQGRLPLTAGLRSVSDMSGVD